VRDFLEGLEQTGWVLAFGKSVFWYGLVTALHYFSVFTLTGTSLIYDVYLLGFVAKDQKPGKFAEQVFPWIWTSMFVAIVSGFLLTLDEIGDYYADPVTRTKVIIVFVAFLLTLFIRRSVNQWEENPSVPGIAKVAAVLSILLWLGAILAGNDIAAISGLG
jgi:hypothetical protein